MTVTIIAIIVLALIASFLTGIHDSSNIATMISSRAYPPRLALLITAAAEFVGPLIFGVEVARTIGRNVVSPAAINMLVVLATLISALLWIFLTWLFRIPGSYSQALVGGFIGSVLVEAGWHALNLKGVAIIMVSLFASPLVSFGIGWLLLIAILRVSWDATPRINNFFKRSQLVSVIALALGQGANDSAKSMGMITLALVIGGYLRVFAVPAWVIVSCAAALALGTAFGGLRLVRTVGGKFYKIHPVDAFTSQVSSAMVIIGASLAGGPVATAQVVSSSVMGVGAAERMNMVRWSLGRDIVISWLLTIPMSAAIAGGLYWVLSRILG